MTKRDVWVIFECEIGKEVKQFSMKSIQHIP